MNTPATGFMLPMMVRMHRWTGPWCGSADAFRGTLNSAYSEGTHNLKPSLIVPSNGDVFDVTFKIELLGDIAHTFVLKGVDVDSIDIDELFVDYSLRGMVDAFPKFCFSEGMTLHANNTFARASGWMDKEEKKNNSPQGEFIIPLMLRETMDSQNTFLPLLATLGMEGVDRQEHTLIITGVKGRKLAESMTLDVDYAYLDTAARKHLASSSVGMFRMITHDFHTQLATPTFEKGVGEIKLDIVNHSVTGLMIKSEELISTVEVFVNQYVIHTWHRVGENVMWKKVGLENPKDGSIIIPFSRNMWKNPKDASIVDFPRVEQVTVKLTLESSKNETCKVEITSLGHKIRIVSQHCNLIDDTMCT